jgi:hypothetical protein
MTVGSPLVSISAFNPKTDHCQRNCDPFESSCGSNGEMTQLFQTAFRQWIAPAEKNPSQDTPVPGLREALANVGLSSFGIAIERWCQENGAAFLSEVADEVENICSDLGSPDSTGLTPELRKRLCRALSSPQGTSELRRANSESIQSVVANIRERMSAAKLAECDCDRILLAGSDEQRVGLEPGLRNAFEQAGLPQLSEMAEAWCRDNGAAFLQEVLDDFDDLCENLSLPDSGCLDAQVRERLKQALSSQVTRDSVKLLKEKTTRKAKSW